jgi:hypothetical protein
MRPCLVFVLTAASAIALCGTAVSAREHCGGHHHHHGCAAGAPCGGCAGCPGDRAYDPDTVSTLRGTAVAVEAVPARDGRAGGIHLTLSSDGSTTSVHVGPSWYVESQGQTLAKGDLLEVTGSVVEAGGARFVVAREIKKGGSVLRLRDERGVPLWAGGRGRD